MSKTLTPESKIAYLEELNIDHLVDLEKAQKQIAELKAHCLLIESFITANIERIAELKKQLCPPRN
jgi:hypothetical protein